jgi:hypothetical protein
MCHQSEMLIVIAIYGMLVALIMPGLNLYFKHVGWPGWLAIPLSFVVALLACSVLFYGLMGASVLSEWWHERRKARKR